MSLIIDALKKTQQLRLKDPEEVPIPNRPSFLQKTRKDQRKKWIMISLSLISLSPLLLVLLKPSSPPPAQTYQVALPVGEKHSSPEFIPLPLESQPDARNWPQRENLSGDKQTSPPIDSVRELKFIEGEEKTQTIKQDKDQKLDPVTTNQALTPHVPSHPIEKNFVHQEPAPLSLPSQPQISPKDELSSKSIGVKQLEKENHSLRLMVLNHFNEGVRYFNQKEFLKAIQAYQKVIEQDPTSIEAYNNIGITYQKMGELEKASEAYQKTIEINPNYEKGYNNLGTLFLLQDRDEEAWEAFHKAIRINANNIESHLNLGILYKKKGQFEKAIESYQTALVINPFHKEAHYNIALLYEQIGKIKLAMNHYQQFIKLSSESQPELVSRVQRHLDRLIQIGETP